MEEPSSSLGFDLVRGNAYGCSDAEEFGGRSLEPTWWRAAEGCDCGSCSRRARHADRRPWAMEQAEGTAGLYGELQLHRRARPGGRGNGHAARTEPPGGAL